MLINPERTLKQILKKRDNPIAELFEKSTKLNHLTKIIQSELPKPLDSHCRALEYLNGSLLIAADNAHWGHHLRFNNSDLLSALRKNHGLYGLANIKIQIHPAASPSLLPESKPTNLPTKCPAGAAYLASTAEFILDETLKKAMQNLAKNLAENR